MDYQEKYPINNSPGGDSVKEAVIKNRNELLNVAKDLGEQPSGGGGLRQRVLYGSSNNGEFNFLASSDLGITIDGRNVPVVITFADGFGDSGGIDYVETIKTMVSAWSLPANNTSYLYVDRSDNGSLSYGSTSIRPAYKTTPPDSIVNAHYFNTLEQKMYLYNGTEWVSKMRVFVASVTTNATTVTAITYLKNEDASSMVVLAGSVDETALADDAITEVKIKNASVTSDKIEDGVVGDKHLTESGVIAGKYNGITVNKEGRVIDAEEVEPPDVFTGATSTTSGTVGFVPAPSIGDQDKVLGANGLWRLMAIASQAEAESGTENTKIMTALRVAQAITKNGVPVGTVINYASSMPPNGFLVCNGGTVSRSAYSNLFSVIGVTFGNGDGSTTFTLPNLTDGRFIEGSTQPGLYRNPGLPNITGQVGWDNRVDVDDNLFKRLGGSARSELTDGRSGTHPVLDFNASRYNGIYGSSNTVQPRSLTLLPCIKY